MKYALGMIVGFVIGVLSTMVVFDISLKQLINFIGELR